MISIIIVTYNSEKFIKECLLSVFAQSYADYELIVVDNGSKDLTLNILGNFESKVKLICNSINLGAAAARNQGIKVSRGEWVFTLDCDVTLEKDFLSVFNQQSQNISGKVGMLQGKILYPDRRTIYTCGINLTWMRRFFDIGNGQIDNGQFNEMTGIFGPCSAAAFYKREMLEELKEETGYFDKRFFFLAEDVDLAWRALKRGWSGLYIDRMLSYHSGHSSGHDKKLRQYLCFRNRYLTMLKNEDRTIGTVLRIFLSCLGYDICRIIYLLATNKYMYIKLQRPDYASC